MDVDALKVKFTHSNTVRDKKPYTIYEIEVRISSTITWVVYKRYSSFSKLHDQLTTQLGIGGLGLKLPSLPPKRLTRSLATEFVEKRKSELEEYIRSMIAIPRVLQSDIMISFLEIPDSVRPLVMRATDRVEAETDRMIDTGANADAYGANDRLSSQAQSGRTLEDRRLTELISKLKSHPNKVAAILSYEEWIFETRPRLSPEQIRFLFQGKNGSDADGGLLQTCGDFKQSRVASRAALQLICRLLDVERNKDFALYEAQFISLHPSVLQKMKLHVHILSERASRLQAFKVAAVLISHVHQQGNAVQGSRTTTTANDRMGASETIILDSIMRDAWARAEFIRWYTHRSDILSVRHTDVSEPSHSRSVISLLNETHTKVVHRGFSEFLRAVEIETGWQTVDTQSSNLFSSPFVAPPMSTSPTSSSSQFQNGIGASQTNNTSNSWIIGNGGLPGNRCNVGPVFGNVSDQAHFFYEDRRSDVHVKLAYCKDTTQDAIVVRASLLLPHGVKAATELLCDAALTSLWNVKVHSSKVVATFDASTDLLHTVYKSFSCPYKFYDFALLRSVSRMEDGGIAILFKSVAHSSCPEYPYFMRCNMIVGGYILTPVRLPNSKQVHGCLLTSILELDKDSVLVIAPDLLGESKTFVDSLKNIDPLLTHIRTTKQQQQHQQLQQQQHQHQQQQQQQPHHQPQQQGQKQIYMAPRMG